jgi:hypothetical protein
MVEGVLEAVIEKLGWEKILFPFPKKIFSFFHNHPICGILSMLLILQGLDNSSQKGDSP